MNKHTDFIRFDGNCPDLPSESRLRSIQQYCDVEFRETPDGSWVVRTIPEDKSEVALAGVGNSLYAAASRLLRVINFSKRIDDTTNADRKTVPPIALDDEWKR